MFIIANWMKLSQHIINKKNKLSLKHVSFSLGKKVIKKHTYSI